MNLFIAKMLFLVLEKSWKFVVEKNQVTFFQINRIQWHIHHVFGRIFFEKLFSNHDLFREISSNHVSKIGRAVNPKKGGIILNTFKF